VYQAALDPSQGSEQAGTRPVIVVSRDAINKYSPVVVIVPVTKRSNKVRILPSHVELKAGEGNLQMDSVALCEQIRAIAVSRLIKNIGKLSSEKISELNGSLKITLDLT
jgi:mRNA interferase MazF